MAREVAQSATAAGLSSIAGIGQIRIYSEMDWLLVNLIDDGLIAFRAHSHRVLEQQELALNAKVVELTDKGAEFLERWIDAEPLK
ncbi:hypothetical protein SAMN04488580_10665 [Mycobacterium sp. 283mftsu]|nr:hypothetical protein SAMN04488580_10665 [Mycobacterium sp. 283mftsu]